MSSVKKETSKFLTENETSELTGKIGDNFKIEATGVIKCFKTTAPTHSTWLTVGTGIVCLLSDPNTWIHFIKAGSMICDEELYLDFTFSNPKPYFVTFEGQISMVGLLFTDLSESVNFMKYLKKAIKSDRKKFGTIHDTLKKNKQPKEEKPPKSATVKKEKFEKSSKKRLSASEIGLPTNFKHIKNIGAVNIPGYSNRTECTDDWLKLFVSLNLNEESIAIPKVASEIVNLVEQHGGIDKVVAKIEESAKKKKIKKREKFKTIKVKKSEIGKSRNFLSQGPKMKKRESIINKQFDSKQDASMPPPPPPPCPPPKIPSRLRSESLPKEINKSPISRKHDDNSNINGRANQRLPPPVPSKLNKNIEPASRFDSETEIPYSTEDSIGFSEPNVDNSRCGLLEQIRNKNVELKKEQDDMDESTIVNVLAKVLENMRIDIDEDSENSQDDDWDD